MVAVVEMMSKVTQGHQSILSIWIRVSRKLRAAYLAPVIIVLFCVLTVSDLEKSFSSVLGWKT